METIKTLIGPAIRHGLTAIGLGSVVTDDGLQQLAGALALIVGFGWSLIKEWRKVKAAKSAGTPVAK